jgi:hypothetical protein
MGIPDFAICENFMDGEKGIIRVNPGLIEV